MKSTVKKILLASLALCASHVFAQEITQTVKGRVIDQVSHLPLPKASVQIARDTAQYGSQTDDNGYFTVDVPVGRYRVRVSYTGYTTFEDELLVVAGKEAIINVSLDATTKTLEEVEVSDAAIEEVPGQRSLTIEKTLRVPANFFDPVRVATAYPGVIAANDQNNSIIVRGNSPNGLLWRLNGLDIVNPNHLANAGTMSDRPAANGGGVNILSAQMLDRTDFYMGALPANYGNVLSGVIDMKLRDGNKSKMEYTAQASLIGLDVAAEGPLDKNGNTSFLANYRYSTVGLLSKIGVDFGDEAITFQDLSLHLNRKGKRGSDLSVFGFYGSSKNDFDAKRPEEWKEDKDRFNIYYNAKTYAAGINYTIPVWSGKLFAGLAYSNSDQVRDGEIPRDMLNAGLREGDQVYLVNGLLSANIMYTKPFSEKLVWDVGVMANHRSDDIKSSTMSSYGELDMFWFNNGGVVLQPFTSFAFSLSRVLTIDAGVRYMTTRISSSLEPRFNVKLKTSAASHIDFSYSLVSQLQPVQVYARSGSLDFTKSHHIDLGFTAPLAKTFDLKTGLFFQHLFDVPVVKDGGDGTFSMLNFMDGVPPGDLHNKGTGYNYGVDATLEKHFYTNHYFMVGGCYYQSIYEGNDGIKRNTRFNGKYTFNGTYGKEWNKPEKNRTIGLNTRVLYLGGLRTNAIKVYRYQDEVREVFDTQNPYSEKLKDYFRVDVRLSFRKNKPGYTRTFAIDIQNLTAQENEAYQYYDNVQQKIVTKHQLGIIPVLVYRIDF